MTERYRLRELLEPGELANLYRAQRADGAAVVVKLFHAKTTDLAYAREFAQVSRELDVLSANPAISQTLDIGLWDKQLAVVRADVKGTSLGQVLRRLETKEVIVSPPLALALVMEIAAVLRAAHAEQVVHGALTPGNVLLGTDGHVAVCDFGVLRAIDAAPALRKTFGSAGRNSYRAPEVTRGEGGSFVSDVYSLGAITYELLTLREPSQERSGAQVSRRAGALPAPSRLDRRINARLDPIVLRALETNAGRRFQDVGEYATALGNFLADSGGLPGDEEIIKLVTDVNALWVPSGAESLPFSEARALTPIAGVELPESPERSISVAERAPFSGGAVPEGLYRDSNPSLSRRVAGGGDVVSGGDSGGAYGRTSSPSLKSARPVAEPKFDDGTLAGSAGPLEKGWEAPPGAAPPRPRAKAEPSASLTRNPRLKVVEDFSKPPSDGVGATPLETASPLMTVLEQPAVAPAPGPPHSTTAEMEAASIPAADARLAGAPAPSRAPTSDYIARMVSESAEEELARPPPARSPEETDARQRQVRLVTAAIAMLGVTGLGLFVWLLMQHPAQNDPLITGAPIPGQVAPTPLVEPLAPAPLPKPPPGPQIDWDNPPTRARAGFLTLRTNVPAYVYVDGSRVRGTTPLTMYPLRPGKHMIKLEAKGTGDEKNFAVTVTRGRTQLFEETGLAARPHR